MGFWVFSKPHAAVALAFALLLCNATLSSSVPAPPPRDSSGEDGDEFKMRRRDWTFILYLYCLMGIFVLMPLVHCMYVLLRQRTVVTVQVVVSARGGDIGSALHGVAARALDWRESLKVTIKKLVGQQQNFIYGSTSVKVNRGITTCLGIKQHLGDLVSKEMKKLEIQRVKLENGRLVPKLGPKQNKDYTLVTIVVVLRGAQQLPSVDSSSEEMKDALNHLDTIINQILVAEVIWGYKDPFAALGLLDSCPNLKSFVA